MLSGAGLCRGPARRSGDRHGLKCTASTAPPHPAAPRNSHAPTPPDDRGTRASGTRLGGVGARPGRRPGRCLGRPAQPRDAARDARAPPASGTTNSPCTNLAPVRLAFLAAECTGAWWYRPHEAPKTSAVSTGAQALSSSRGYVS